MKINIGINIKRLRAERSVTQDQLAEAMNVTCAAVSKWEREDSYPDITLLQPLAYYFGVTLDELMGYDRERVSAQIDEAVAKYWEQALKRTKEGAEAARKIITDAYREYPNDYTVMSCYMWFIAGDAADNDPDVIIAHKDEFHAICDKILDGCADDEIRLGAWNMRAKILWAERKTDEALEIYRTKFTNWFSTCGQKCEQLFAKDTDEYYYWVRRNMYELFSFAADKLGRVVFFGKELTLEEKTQKSLLYGDVLLDAYERTGEDAFLIVAQAFLGRMENDLCYRGGSNRDVAAVMDANLHTLKLLTERLRENGAFLDNIFAQNSFLTDADGDLAHYLASCRKNDIGGRRAELLSDPDYARVLEKYLS